MATSTAPVRSTAPAVERTAWASPARWLHAPWVQGAALMAAMVLYFSLALPGQFATTDTFKSVFENGAALMILALGVTPVLIVREFDLSFAATIGLAGACAVMVMANLGMSVPVAFATAVGVGIVVGLVNGVCVSFGRAPAFIVTLAVGSVLLGIESLLTDNQTIATGIPDTYLNFTLSPVLGLAASTWLMILLVIVMASTMAWSTYGRRVRATGLNPTAATLAGISAGWVRVSTFVILGAFAGLVGVIITSQGASYFPNTGAGMLLPPYSAVFLGGALIARGRFTPIASVYGVAFIALLERGLTMQNWPSALIDLLEGAVLLAAVLLARTERRRA